MDIGQTSVGTFVKHLLSPSDYKGSALLAKLAPWVAYTIVRTLRPVADWGSSKISDNEGQLCESMWCTMKFSNGSLRNRQSEGDTFKAGCCICHRLAGPLTIESPL